MTLPTWFDHPVGSFSCKEIQLKWSPLPPVKTSHPPAEKVNETPGGS